MKKKFILYFVSLFVLAGGLSAQVTNNIKWSKVKTKPPGMGNSLAEFCEDVATQVSSHDWNILLDRCDPEHKDFQMSPEHMGMDKYQYILEILGLNYVDNHLPGDQSAEDKLFSITGISLDKVSKKSMWENEVIGSVFIDGEKMDCELRLRIRWNEQDGVWYLYASVG